MRFWWVNHRPRSLLTVNQVKTRCSLQESDGQIHDGYRQGSVLLRHRAWRAYNLAAKGVLVWLLNAGRW